MIKVFKNNHQNKWYEIKLINIETGEYTSYNQDINIGFTFGKPYITTVFKMGYDSTKNCLKELKNRGYLGNEITLEEQLESEKQGYINLVIERIRRNKNYDDVIEKLTNKYNMTINEIDNIITSKAS